LSAANSAVSQNFSAKTSQKSNVYKTLCQALLRTYQTLLYTFSRPLSKENISSLGIYALLLIFEFYFQYKLRICIKRPVPLLFLNKK